MQGYAMRFTWDQAMRGLSGWLPDAHGPAVLGFCMSVNDGAGGSSIRVGGIAKSYYLEVIYAGGEPAALILCCEHGTPQDKRSIDFSSEDMMAAIQKLPFYAFASQAGRESALAKLRS